jgi:YD repeat-containing protein
VTYPDNSTRQFGYDENHLMTSQTDQRGFINTYQFNSAGQFTQSTQADGSVRSLTPAQSIGLVEEVSKNNKTNPAKLVRIKIKRQGERHEY